MNNNLELHSKNRVEPIKKGIVLISLFLAGATSFAQVKLEKEVKISDSGLFFDGKQVSPGSANAGADYDFIFGSRITPHGDCIKEYDGFVFMTWYRGGKSDRHVMLTRYNTKTGVTKTIEFPHQHNGFQNTPHLGESHNTIAVGVCPLDGTIHMLYDMHAYDENKPSNGSLANDYFRYSYSKKNAATVPDDQFNINQFVNSPSGNYKHLKMRSGTNYKSLTYPNFFNNTRGELFMWIREGGNNNGAYKFCKYNGTSWSDFTQFNVLTAKSFGNAFNWGLYGDIKFESGKMRIVFQSRYNDNNDVYKYNNGFHYAYSDDPNGLNQWKDHTGKSLSLPLINPNTIKVSEPGNVVPQGGANSVTMSKGSDWTVTENGDIHMVTTVSGGGQNKNVHTYKKAGASTFTTTTSFPGGNLYTYQNRVYLIGLEGGRVFVEEAAGGTNTWKNIYQSTTGKTFRHGNVFISNGKLHFFLMENKSGSAQPIYLQILDLGLDVSTNQKPSVSLTSPLKDATYTLGESIPLSATALDSDGSISKVEFKVDDVLFKTDASAPYSDSFTPTSVGSYKIAAKAFDNDGATSETFLLVNVVSVKKDPIVEFTSPESNSTYILGQAIPLAATASDPDGSIAKVNFKIQDAFYKTDNSAPFENTFTPDSIGTYKIAARAFDNENLQTEVFVTVNVVGPNRAPEGSFLEPLEDQIIVGYDSLIIEVDASDPDNDDVSVVLFIDNVEIRKESVEPYIWGRGNNMEESKGLSLGKHILKAVITDSKGLSTTILKEITVTLGVGVDQHELSDFTITPNPSSGIFNLKKITVWEVYNLNGQLMEQGTSKEINLSAYPKGMYIFKTEDRTMNLVKF